MPMQHFINIWHNPRIFCFIDVDHGWTKKKWHSPRIFISSNVNKTVIKHTTRSQNACFTGCKIQTPNLIKIWCLLVGRKFVLTMCLSLNISASSFCDCLRYRIYYLQVWLRIGFEPQVRLCYLFVDSAVSVRYPLFLDSTFFLISICCDKLVLEVFPVF